MSDVTEGKKGRFRGEINTGLRREFREVDGDKVVEKNQSGFWG